ncbi:MAG: phenylpyruvate tautomerase MIF-related protein [Gammaproteobacteria bacterium]|nr:phenylpyruvate tautomerase MIF-related protein [Gammaproteobacteria bacterium]
MPLLSIDTNVALEKDKADILIRSASSLLANMLGKPESYVMVKYEHNPYMLFAGNDAPLIYAEIKSLGLPEERTREFSEKLTDFFQKETGVAADRVYIEFASPARHMWGWNSSTF